MSDLSTNTIIIVGFIVLLFINVVMFSIYSRKRLKEFKKLNKQKFSFTMDDFHALAAKLEIKSQKYHVQTVPKAVPPEVEKEIDDTLGLVNIRTKVSAELYENTVARVMKEHDFVPQAAVRHILQHYDDARWRYFNDDEDYVFPIVDTPIIICCNSEKEEFAAVLKQDPSGDFVTWCFSDGEMLNVELPKTMIVTRWKYPNLDN
jgi:hypothetical protein